MRGLKPDGRGTAVAIAELDRLQAICVTCANPSCGAKAAFYSQEDDDAIHQLLLTYLNLRTALLRTIWTYRAAPDDLMEGQMEARALLLAYASAATLLEIGFRHRRYLRRRPSRPSANSTRETRPGRSRKALTTVCWPASPVRRWSLSFRKRPKHLSGCGRRVPGEAVPPGRSLPVQPFLQDPPLRKPPIELVSAGWSWLYGK